MLAQLDQEALEAQDDVLGLQLFHGVISWFFLDF